MLALKWFGGMMAVAAILYLTEQAGETRGDAERGRADSAAVHHSDSLGAAYQAEATHQRQVNNILDWNQHHRPDPMPCPVVAVTTDTE